jgi:hypothetical protein
MCERGKENERELRPISLRSPLSGVTVKEIEGKNCKHYAYATTKSNNTNATIFSIIFRLFFDAIGSFC